MTEEEILAVTLTYHTLTNRFNMKKLTPFEQAAHNQRVHPKRMALTHKVTELVRQLEEAEAFIRMAESQSTPGGMYDPELLAHVRKEVATITSTLIVVANTFEGMGISA